MSNRLITGEISLEDRLVDYVHSGEGAMRDLPDLFDGATVDFDAHLLEVEEALYSALDHGRVRFAKLGSAIAYIAAR